MATLDNVNLFANGGPTSNSIEDEYQKLVAVINSPGVMGSPPSFEEFVAKQQILQKWVHHPLLKNLLLCDKNPKQPIQLDEP